MLDEGLKHTQKVYAGVKEFTNLVKEECSARYKTIRFKRNVLKIIYHLHHIQNK
jgi:hypothetical protein